ncbi:MAG: glutathione peroxidase [Pseudomonadota bacterium]
MTDTPTIADFAARSAQGEETSLADRLGKVVLVVNVASQCGFTPQYKGLERLWRNHRDRGFEVLAFPCNQFGSQEPGTAEEISSFCSLRYDVTFPVMDKVEVNGPQALPLYAWLKAEAPGLLGSRSIKWNFTKFLIGRDGKVVRRYAPTQSPGAIEADIAALL